MINRVAFTILGLDIMWYGLLIGIGVALALVLAKYNMTKNGASFDTFLDIFIWAFPMGVIGSRLYYVAFEFETYKDDLLSIFDIRSGGLAIHGGLIFGILTALIYCKVKKIDFLMYADNIAPSLILAQAIGRWGNFINQEAHGREVSKEFISKFPKFIQEGMHINGTYYHPTFLYESMYNLLIMASLIIILYKISKKYKGIVIYSYIMLYSFGRFFIESLRTDSLLVFGLRTAQVVSIIGFIAGLIMIIYTVRKYKDNK